MPISPRNFLKPSADSLPNRWSAPMTAAFVGLGWASEKTLAAASLDLQAPRAIHGVGPEVVDLFQQRGVAAEDAAQRDRHADLELLGLPVSGGRRDEGTAGHRERPADDEEPREPAHTARSQCH